MQHTQQQQRARFARNLTYAELVARSEAARMARCPRRNVGGAACTCLTVLPPEGGGR